MNFAPANSAYRESAPFLSADNQELYFESTRPGGSGGTDIWLLSNPQIELLPISVTDLNTANNDTGVAQSEDSLTLIFMSDRPGGVGGEDIYMCVRSAMDAPWHSFSPIGGISGIYSDREPCIRWDGLEMFFVSDRSGGPGGADIWRSSRASVSTPWDTPTLLATASTSYLEAGPALSPNGLELYFSSNRSGGLGGEDIYKVSRPNLSSLFGAPVSVPSLNSSSNDSAPALSRNGLVIFFASNRPGGVGDMDIWYATRPSLSSPWSKPVNFTPCNSPYRESEPFVSADWKELYFESNRPGTSGGKDIWVIHNPFGLLFSGRAPQIQTATLSDMNNNGIIEAGEQLVLTLDHSVVVTTSVLRASHFFLPVQSDSLGGVGFRSDTNRYNSRQIVLTLGQGVRLKAAGVFSAATRTAGSPSAIDFATSLPSGAIMSLEGVPATDGGVPGFDDTGVDIEWNAIGQQGSIGPSGGAVAVANSSDAAYKQHRLTIPAGDLGAATNFTLRPPAQNLGVIDAVQIQSGNPGVTFASPATILLQYRDGDIDRDQGLLESEMTVHQLVENPVGVFAYLPLAGSQVNTSARQVSVAIANLNPRGSVGATRVFADLPLETVEDRTVFIRQGTGTVVVTPGSNGAYTLHKIEIPNYVTTTSNDANRLIVTIRTAVSAERNSPSGGHSFPSQSGAVFVVSVTNPSDQGIQFTAPVNVTVQFKSRPDPARTDLVTFNGQPAPSTAMRLVFSQSASAGVDFTFVSAPSQTVNAAQGTVTVRNVVGLTGPDGVGAFGAVGSGTAAFSPRWEWYR
jgi:hypothetical protein